MPVKLFPQLRLLKPTLPVTGFPLTMKPGAWVQPSHRVLPVFSRVFPLRFRYSGGRALHLLRNENGELGVRRFSTRHLGKEARKASSSSESLIEDESELSDWASDLRSGCLRGLLTSEDEASDVNKVRNRTRDRDSKGGGESISMMNNNKRMRSKESFDEARMASSSSKSLIEDESELSDWASDLRSGSLRGLLTSEDEASDVNKVRNRTRDRDSKGGGESISMMNNNKRMRSKESFDEARMASSSSKSLIEDESELSDWASDLRSGSLQGLLTSEDEASDVNRVRNRTRDRDSKGGGESISMMNNNKRMRSKESFDEARSASSSSKSLIEDESELSDWASDLRSGSLRGLLTSEDEASDVNRVDESNRNSRVSRRFGSALEDNEGEGEGVSWRANGGFRSGNEMGRKGGREMDKGYERNKNVMGRREVDKGYVRDRNVNRGSDGLREGVKDSIKQLRWMDDDDDDVNMRSRNVNRGTEGLRKGVNNLMKQDLIKEPRWTNDEDGEKLLPTIGDFLSEEDSDSQDEEDDDDDELLKKSASSMFGLDDEVSARVLPRPSSSKSDTQSYLSETRFDQCSVSPLSLKGIKDAGYEKMTVVQEATLPVILKGKDVLAKARTGTGKTVAFLLPSIEVVVKSPPIGRDQKWPPILVLVICPTRELASQAAAEANILLKYHPSIGVQVVIGGTRLALEQKCMQANPCQILVATPGRLRDHIENTAGFATRLMGVKVLVLDEADHLLDMGFRKDIEKIIAAVPKHRQTLLFSATVPEEVRQISHIALKRDHEFINTVQEGTEETHSQVRQMHLVAPLDKHFSLLYVLLKDHIADDVDYKVLVFCTTAMVTRLVADLLGELNLNVREIHSRKPQSYRTRISDEFRKSKGLILVTSDVSARGVDYPDVTLVIQVGLPSDREQYIHRLGRTGRKGKEGQGILLLAPWEEFFLSTIKDLPISKAPVHLIDPDTKKKVERALSQVEMKNKETAYQAWLGYYNSNKKVGRDKHRLVELANEFSRSMGLDNPPAIPKLVLGKMGLRNISGLRSK